MLNLSYGPWEKIELEIELFIKKKIQILIMKRTFQTF